MPGMAMAKRSARCHMAMQAPPVFLSVGCCPGTPLPYPTPRDPLVT